MHTAAANLRIHDVSFADAEQVFYDPLVDKNKTRITIYIDTVILDEFRARAMKAGTGYQTMMNEALKAYLSGGHGPVTEQVLRNVLREELPEYVARPRRSRKK